MGTQAGLRGIQDMLRFRFEEGLGHYHYSPDVKAENKALVKSSEVYCNLEVRNDISFKPREKKMTVAKEIGSFNVGDEVEYYSESRKEWMKCKVSERRDNGEVAVDIKPGFFIKADQAKNCIRSRGAKNPYSAYPKPGVAAAVPQWTLGQRVSYHSKSTNTWMDSKIARIHPNGDIEVDISGAIRVVPKANVAAQLK